MKFLVCLVFIFAIVFAQDDVEVEDEKPQEEESRAEFLMRISAECKAETGISDEVAKKLTSGDLKDPTQEGKVCRVTSKFSSHLKFLFSVS